MILDKFKLDGRVALVTGAATGLGQAIAIALAEAGADVVPHCRKEGDAAETISRIQQLGRRTLSVFGDMGEKEVPAKIVNQVLEEFDRIDIIINNAGTIRRAPAVDYSEDDWSTVIEVNLSSVFRL